MKKKIVVVGSDGQLGTALKKILVGKLFFFNKTSLDITNISILKKKLLNLKPQIIINCAAYTNVDQAEIDSIKCFNVNSIGVKNLCTICEEINASFVHISTDYVFDGIKSKEYKVNDKPNPINFYGYSKLIGEYFVLNSRIKNFIIIRTSWIYSLTHKNFISTIINNIQKKKIIYTPSNFIGMPTFVDDLAKFILQTINACSKKKEKNKIFHFNDGVFISRYECTKFILKLMKKNFSKVKVQKIIPIDINNLYLKAKRPLYLKLKRNEKSKFNNKFYQIFFLNNLSKMIEVWKK